MKRLEDLKTDLLADKVEKFYIFYGEDVGIRKHYIDRISTYFDDKLILDNWEVVRSTVSTKSLFKLKQLILVFNDEDFAKQPESEVTKLLMKLNGEFTCIFIYDTDNFEKTALFKNFEQYVTNFQSVQDNIAKEFIESELDGLNNTSEEDMAFNCSNLYSNILLEADKIKEYQDYMGISQQSAYDALSVKNQLLSRDKEFSCNSFMDCVLQGDYINMAYWCDILMSSDNPDIFMKYLTFMFNDFLIAGLISANGYYDGSTRAYNYGLPWGRTKEIRDLKLKFDNEYYYTGAYKICEIDKLVKSGKLSRDKILDYFLSKVI